MPIATVNPANGETLKTYEAMGEEELERRLQLAEATFRTYRTTSFADRAQLLNKAADLLDEDQREIGRVMTTEMGKPVKQARAEAAKCAKAMRWYAQNAERLLADEEPAESDVRDSGASRVRVRYRPLGPVLAVMPWNFPLWQVVRFAAPALMAGNVGLLKHASNVPQTALYLEDLFHRAGFPEGCFQTLLIGSGAVDEILRDERVKAATLTGSEPAGRSVASTSGEMIKKTVLELGGSDPFVVMPSADLDRAAEGRGDRARAEQRPVLHRRQAVHRAHRRLRRLRREVRRGHEGPQRRRPAGGGDRGRSARQRAGQEGPGGAGRRRQAQRGPGAVRRGAAGRAGLVLPADRPHRHHPGDAHPP
ncbi:hypothetical protein GCM10017687_43520 [Streptomyces echinatus]